LYPKDCVDFIVDFTITVSNDSLSL
jgi:hypothetical protein